MWFATYRITVILLTHNERVWNTRVDVSIVALQEHQMDLTLVRVSQVQGTDIAIPKLCVLCVCLRIREGCG